MARVVGFHACKRKFAEAPVRGEIKIADWKPSANPYDWLGKGIYFWEQNQRRAQQWAVNNVKGKAAIIKAEVELGVSLNLASSEYLGLIRKIYDDLVVTYGENGWSMPVNRKSGLHDLDRLVMDEFMDFMELGGTGQVVKFDTICAPFEEGEPIFPGSYIRDQSHVQIAVRNNQMIQAIELVD
jgi:hypothetical protein